MDTKLAPTWWNDPKAVRSHETIYCPLARDQAQVTWEEAVRGCTVKGYNFFCSSKIYLKMYPVSFPCGLLFSFMIYFWNTGGLK